MKLTGILMKKLLFIFGVVLTMAGCATRPVSIEDSVFVPKNRILDSSLLSKASGTGQVIIKRDSGFGGSACSNRVYVDGKAIADLGPSEKVVVYPTIGQHIFSSWPNGICGGGMTEISGEVTESSVKVFRVGYGSNGDFGIHPTAF